MQLRCGVSVIAMLLTLLAGSTFSQSQSPTPSSQSPSPTPSIESRNGSVSESPPPLPPDIRNTLEAELAYEEKAKKIGLPTFRWFPMPVCVDAKCGAVNRDGTFAVVPSYDRVDSFFEGIAVVQVRHGSGYLYGYVDETGRVISKPQFAIAGEFSRGFAQFDFEGKSGLIDRDGRVALPPLFGFVLPFTNDRFWVTEERNVIHGNTGAQKFRFAGSIEPTRVISLAFYGVAAADTVVRPKGNWGLVDRAGAWIRRPEFLEVGTFDLADSRLMWAKTDAGWGLIRPDLSWQVKPKFEGVRTVYNGLAAIMLDHRWGFVDTSGRIVIEASFDHVGEFT